MFVSKNKATTFYPSHNKTHLNKIQPGSHKNEHTALTRKQATRSCVTAIEIIFAQSSPAPARAQVKSTARR